MDKDLVTFIRIPKNASTSVYAFLGETNTIRNELLDADNETYLNIFEPSHCSIKDAVKNLGKKILTKPVLAIVRNPYERLVSMFFFARLHNLGSLYDIDTNDFDNFAEGFYKLSKTTNFFHAMSQTEYILHDDADNFTVIRFEDLQIGLHVFINKSGLGGLLNVNELPKLNGTIHKHYSEYYSDKSKAIVTKMWACDLDKFNYSFN